MKLEETDTIKVSSVKNYNTGRSVKETKNTRLEVRQKSGSIMDKLQQKTSEMRKNKGEKIHERL